MNTQNFLQDETLDFTVENDFRELAKGKHAVRLANFCFLTDRHKNFKGEMKTEKLPPWSDSTPQLACTFTGKNGTKTHRFSLVGYVKFKDIPEEDQVNYKSMGDAGYATQDGKRIVKAEATTICRSILSRLLKAVGTPEGTKIESIKDVTAILSSAVETKGEFIVTVNDNGDIASTYAMKSEAPVKAEPKETM